MKKLFSYFTKAELTLWLCSVTVIVASFLVFDKTGYLTLTASLIGVSSLIFCAKGNPVGQVLMIIFSLLYGYISYGFAYYGEMVTYLGMTLPMSVFSLVSWLKNPYKGNKSVVAVNRVGKKEIPFMLLLTLGITIVFYFILKHLGTANLLPSSLSVATSFAAA
ncbi:MAG: nicotinamide mononucleotide transporter, partial [Clostridia bacterium]|nr:nicotinamide mononucleotide transporter [Clostridia bacterium]